VNVEGEQPLPAPNRASEVPAEDRLSLAAQDRPADRYLNRELSWLDFNEHVLAFAERRSLPVLERAKFLAIFSDNLDDFFQVRVGSLKMQQEAGIAAGTSGEATREKLEAITARVGELLERRRSSSPPK